MYRDMPDEGYHRQKILLSFREMQEKFSHCRKIKLPIQELKPPGQAYFPEKTYLCIS